MFLFAKCQCETGTTLRPCQDAVAVRCRPRGMEETVSNLRWGVLSTADIARKKVIPGLRRSARSELVAIASRDEAQARAVAEELDIPRAHGSYQALLDDPDVDAVYIPLPNHLHAEWTIAAARAGKHILCEKPLATTAADAERMVEAADDVRGPSDGGVHVPPPPVVAGGHRPGPGRTDRARCWRSRAGSRTTTTTRPTSATSSTSAAARCTTSAATTSACRACCSTPSRSTSSRPSCATLPAGRTS